MTNLNSKCNNKIINKLNKEESNNQLKISNYLLNRISHKDNKNKKNNKNIFNLNYNFNNINDKRKAHSSSLSKNKKHKFTKKNVQIHNTNNIIINSITDINKKQKTLNNIVSSFNRIKPLTIKCLKKSKINIGNDTNDQLKIKTITLSHLKAWNSKNKLNKKSINSIGSSLNNTKNINRTKTKSNSKSNSKNNKNKNSYNKLLTENIKNEKSNIYNNRIKAIHKDKTLIIKKVGKLNENAIDKKLNKNFNVKNVNKNLLKNKTNYSNFNSFQNNIENNNITDSHINLNKKRGIKLLITGQNHNKQNNARINNIIYNINKKNIYLNNNSSKLKCNESNNIHNSMKKNNITNNQKGKVSKNPKNMVNNNNYNASVTSKKPIDFMKQKKIIDTS